ncbi:hypothetical protein [Noviherbaspirillum pedocola]|jgi:hypothetical protein|uniref:Uncharacterized protein n=1 Tax=Noviherbaspirillum pedocola TaxID=2801341 RepID=A0A934WA06_9BURK|nr:hypothetical protein [Noviherbaspirillum pedocola]MBK4737919.1 hypothetical protein [Noviherbaspirillum pedocola]
MKISRNTALFSVAMLAAVPLALGIAWEADAKHRAWLNDPRPAEETVMCADAQEALLANPLQRQNIDMHDPGSFRWSVMKLHEQLVKLCK